MKKYVSVLVLCILIVFISGCKQKEEDYPQPVLERTVDWKIEGFHAPEEIVMKQSLWAGDYLPWEHKPQNSSNDSVSHIGSGVCGDTFWFLGAEIGSAGVYVPGPNGEYVLELYDAANSDYTTKYFTPADIGMDGELGYLVGMDMLSDENYMFRWAEYIQDEEGMYCQTADKIVFSNLAGDNQSIDFWEKFQEEKIETYRSTILPLWPSIKCCGDAKGNVWILQQKQSGNFVFYLFNQNADILLEHKGTTGQSAIEPFRTREGELILPVYDNKESRYVFLWADTEKGQFTSLAHMEAPSPSILQVYGLSGNDIYYRMANPEFGIGEGIVKWNIASGEQVGLFEFKVAGVANYDTMLAFSLGKEPILRMQNHKDNVAKDWLVPLVGTMQADEGAIRVVDFTGGGSQVEICASKASMETPNQKYVYEDASAEEARTRVFAELSQGKGPDIMFVTMEDLYAMSEKNMLLDIDALLAEEIRQELIPAVLEIGRVDGKLLGMPTGVCAETFAVHKDIAKADEWTLEEMISLMDRGKLAGAIHSPYMMSGYLAPTDTMIRLVLYSLEHSFLIDWESRKSHFDDERFVRLMELISTDRSSQVAEGWEETDLVWGYFFLEMDLTDFFTNLEGESMQIVGYPGGNGGGNYLLPDGGVVVVNAKTPNREEVKFFLELLLGKEIQAETTQQCLSVRKLIPEDYLATDEEGKLVYMGGMNAERVCVFEDGTTPLHRAKEFLESCVPAPRMHYQINRIISEEMNHMYAEGKTPQETADIINNRIQIYLDETRDN